MKTFKVYAEGWYDGDDEGDPGDCEIVVCAVYAQSAEEAREKVNRKVSTTTYGRVIEISSSSLFAQEEELLEKFGIMIIR